jgi:hypothetical protein
VKTGLAGGRIVIDERDYRAARILEPELGDGLGIDVTNHDSEITL